MRFPQLVLRQIGGDGEGGGALNIILGYQKNSVIFYVFMNFDKVVSDVVGCGTLGVLVFIKSVLRMMVPSWGIWRTLSFPVWRLVGQGHLLCH